jgi:DNA-binding MarR family transcriptional regulator
VDTGADTGLTRRAATAGADPLAEARQGWTAAGWGLTSLAMVNITSIMRVQQILLAQINAALRPHRLTFARLEVLTVLLLVGEHGGLSLGRVSARLQVNAGAVTSAVDRLEADGLVRREAHPTDGRAILAVITPQGRELARRAIDDLNAQVLETFEPRGETGEELFALLRQIRAAAGDLGQAGAATAA